MHVMCFALLWNCTWRLPMVKCSNAQMVKCSNAQMVKCSNAQMHKWPNAQVFKCTNDQMVKWSNAQMLKCTNAHAFLPVCFVCGFICLVFARVCFCHAAKLKSAYARNLRNFAQASHLVQTLTRQDLTMNTKSVLMKLNNKLILPVQRCMR